MFQDLPNRSLIKYLLVIEEFGGWQLFQQLLQTLRGIADRHTPLQLLTQDAVREKQVSIAMVAIQYVLCQKQVGGVIIGAHNEK